MAREMRSEAPPGVEKNTPISFRASPNKLPLSKDITAALETPIDVAGTVTLEQKEQNDQ